LTFCNVFIISLSLVTVRFLLRSHGLLICVIMLHVVIIQYSDKAWKKDIKHYLKLCCRNLLSNWLVLFYSKYKVPYIFAGQKRTPLTMICTCTMSTKLVQRYMKGKNFARIMQQYHLYILNLYNLVYILVLKVAYQRTLQNKVLPYILGRRE
jgi:hypothetical protein